MARASGTRAVLCIALCALALRLGAALNPYATVTGDDGTVYKYYNTGESITADDAAAACAAEGGLLASMTSKDQVLASIWSDTVVAAEDSTDPDAPTTFLWTGAKISWPLEKLKPGRRMLREEQPAADADDVLQRLVAEMEASGDAVPTRTSSGRLLPQEVRVMLYQRRQLQQASKGLGRSLLRQKDNTGNESPYLDSADLRWADGASTDLLRANPGNLGFLTCNKQKVAECCGGAYDIGADSYSGSDYPAIFFYPCNVTKSGGYSTPSGYMCSIASVAELPGGKKPSPSPTPAPKPCKKGSFPVVRRGKTKCHKCDKNTFSDDGLKCQLCPEGTKAPKGSSSCA